MLLENGVCIHGMRFFGSSGLKVGTVGLSVYNHPVSDPVGLWVMPCHPGGNGVEQPQMQEEFGYIDRGLALLVMRLGEDRARNVEGWVL